MIGNKKTKKEGFMQGVITLMFSQVLIKILGLVYTLYLTNRDGFGDKGNGICASGYQIYALLLTISSIGVPSAISKLVSERVATEAAKLLRGKHKPTFTPNIDTGDHVIILNVKDVILTGNKLNQKIYRHHSGYIGGMKETPAKVMLEKNPEKAMTLAIKGMLPHNSLGRAQLKKLRVYAGAEHENQAQKPEVWEVK